MVKPHFSSLFTFQVVGCSGCQKSLSNKPGKSLETLVGISCKIEQVNFLIAVDDNTEILLWWWCYVMILIYDSFYSLSRGYHVAFIFFQWNWNTKTKSPLNWWLILQSNCSMTFIWHSATRCFRRVKKKSLTLKAILMLWGQQSIFDQLWIHLV